MCEYESVKERDKLKVVNGNKNTPLFFSFIFFLAATRSLRREPRSILVISAALTSGSLPQQNNALYIHTK